MNVKCLLPSFGRHGPRIGILKLMPSLIFVATARIGYARSSRCFAMFNKYIMLRYKGMYGEERIGGC